VGLTNGWPELTTDYSNKLSRTEEELKRFKKELEKKSQENNEMKRCLSSYKEKYEELKNKELMNKKCLNSTTNKYENESTVIQNLHGEVRECKKTIKNLCNQITNTHKALNIYCQQLGETKMDEQYIMNLKQEEAKLVVLINEAKHKSDNGIKDPLKLELKILENQVKYHGKDYKEMVKEIETLERANRDLERKNREANNKLRQFNSYNVSPTNNQPTIKRQDPYNIQYTDFDIKRNKEHIDKGKIKGITAYNKGFYQPATKDRERLLEPVNNDNKASINLTIQEQQKEISGLKSDLQGERTTNQELRNEIRDLKEKQSKDIKRLTLRYPRQDNLAKSRINKTIKKFNSLFPKIHKLATIIKARKEDNEKVRKVILDLYEKCLRRIDDTKVKLNNEVKALEQKVNEINKLITNQRNNLKSNNLECLKNSLKKILNTTSSDDNVEKIINKVNDAIKKLTAENENLDAKCKNLLNKKIALEEEIKQLNVIILKNEDLIKKDSSKIKEKDTKYEKLLTEFNDLKRKLEAQEEVEAANKERIELNENLKKLNKDLEDRNKSFIEEKNNLVRKYEETKNALQDEMVKLRRENINLKNELSNSKTQTKQLDDLVNESKRKDNKLKEYEDENKKLKEEISELKRKYEKDKEEKEFGAKNELVQGRLEKPTAPQTGANSILCPDVLWETSEQLKKEINELRNTLKESEEKIKEQEEEKKKLKSEYNKLATESARKSSTITKLQLDTESLEAQIKEYERIIEEHEKAQG